MAPNEAPWSEWLAAWHRRTPLAVCGLCGPATNEGAARFPALHKVVGLVADGRREDLARFLGTHAWLVDAPGTIVDPTAHQYQCPGYEGAADQRLVPIDALVYYPNRPEVRLARTPEDRLVLCPVCWRPYLEVDGHNDRVCQCHGDESLAAYLRAQVGPVHASLAEAVPDCKPVRDGLPSGHPGRP